jgi:4-hydroxy-4-methyl-2-oxoglutarate aldolase
MTMPKSAVVILASLAVLVPARAQVFKLTRDQMIQYTSANPFDRFPDGRPKVPDSILERVKGLSAEEVFGIEHQGYPSQYEGDWKIVKPEKIMVGRAVTLLLMPLRQEVADVDSTGLPSKMPRERQITHQSALNLLQPGDVIVVDAHTIAGGVIGDNLAAYIHDMGAGFVIDGALRDLDGIKEIDMTGYYRQAVPSYLTNCMVAGINVPVTIGKVTVMPGDVVFGDREGVYFIPPQLAKEVVDRADTTHIHDEWTKMKFATGKYKSTDIYPSPTDPALKKEYEEYLKEHLKKN